MSEFDYFSICKTCNLFCCQIFNAFIATNEVERINEKIRKSNLDFLKNKENFFDFKLIDYDSQQLPSRLLKKNKDNKCIFLNNDKKCIIHEVKPLDCRIWPITFDYKPEENKLIIYLGSCPLSSILPESWVEATINQMVNELRQFDIDQLISYSISLSPIKDLKIIKVVQNFK